MCELRLNPWHWTSYTKYQFCNKIIENFEIAAIELEIWSVGLSEYGSLCDLTGHMPWPCSSHLCDYLMNLNPFMFFNNLSFWVNIYLFLCISVINKLVCVCSCLFIFIYLHIGDSSAILLAHICNPNSFTFPVKTILGPLREKYVCQLWNQVLWSREIISSSTFGMLHYILKITGKFPIICSPLLSSYACLFLSFLLSFSLPVSVMHIKINLSISGIKMSM